tara:strand:- start:1834 stop:2139 length:306 start_codon:yes stop_codon:yes gene_type:complete
MLASLNLCTVLENYCYSKNLSDKQLDFLDRCWLESLNTFHYNRYPNIAPAIVCDKAGVQRGSYWITCNAAILDRLRPVDSGKTRSARIYDALFQSGIAINS